MDVVVVVVVVCCPPPPRPALRAIRLSVLLPCVDDLRAAMRNQGTSGENGQGDPGMTFGGRLGASDCTAI